MSSFNFDKFRRDFEQTVSKLEKEYKIKIDIGRIRYDATEFRCKLTATFLKAGIKAKDHNVEKANWARHCSRYTGNVLKPEHWHMAWNDVNYGMTRFVNIKPKNRKYPIIIECLATGETYKTNWRLLKDRVNVNELVKTK
jgi:hypothetical protein